jgi:hypothetical protein
VIKESPKNTELADISSDLSSCCSKPGTLVIIDLTDGFIPKSQANSIFQILAQQYKGIVSPVPLGKQWFQMFCDTFVYCSSAY